MKSGNTLSLDLTDNPGLAEILKAMQPGDSLDFKLGNGTSSAEGKFVIDELLSDRVTGQIEDLEVGGEEEAEPDEGTGEDGDEGDDQGDESKQPDGKAKPKSSAGVSIMAVMGKNKPS